MKLNRIKKNKVTKIIFLNNLNRIWKKKNNFLRNWEINLILKIVSKHKIIYGKIFKQIVMSKQMSKNINICLIKRWNFYKIKMGKIIKI